MMRSLYLGRLIFNIQRERDQAILYISSIGPSTKSFLIEEYGKTDRAFEEMWSWPSEFATNPNKHFRTKDGLLNYITSHRTALDPATSNVYGEVEFYMDIVDFLMQWLVDNVKESGFGNTWKTLVVFQKITQCTLDAGVERALGVMFFAKGNFPDDFLYDNYSRRLARFNMNYRTATYYSDLVDPLIDERSNQVVFTQSIGKMRSEIRESNAADDYKSVAKAQFYFDNVTFRIDHLYRLQDSVADRIVRRINRTVDTYTNQIVTYSIMASIVIIACPFIVVFTEALTSNMQSYSKTLVKASSALTDEKRKTDSLIYQMLPRTIAERLKRSSKVDSEYFKSATVLFTSIAEFTQISIEYSPMDLVNLLNALYTSMDARLERHDVYKVETINDTYMVVSGRSPWGWQVNVTHPLIKT